jgi:putative hydrolase of the HAD superfamily
MSDVKGILFDVGGTLIKEGGGELFSGVAPTLSILRSSYKLGIVTNTDIKTERDIREILRKFGVEGYFDTVVVSRDVGYRKPDGRIFHIALDRLGLQPEEALMVGNKTDVDVKGGKAVGMKTVLITWHNEFPQEPLPEEEKPTYIISSIEELLSVI